jgi:hypothetical protein
VEHRWSEKNQHFTWRGSRKSYTPGRSVLLMGAGLMILTLALIPTYSASAHGDCYGRAVEPYKVYGGAGVRGPSKYKCDFQHDKYKLSGCLQKKSAATGNWIDVDCFSRTFGPGLSNATVVSWYGEVSCSTGKFRSKFTYGASFNNAGELDQEQVSNTVSTTKDVQSCG